MNARSILVPIAAVVASAACGGSDPGQVPPLAPGEPMPTDVQVSALVREVSPIDFFVEDVCVDEHDQAILGMSPADAACKTRRDLRPGERVAYHKLEYPGRTFVQNNGSDGSKWTGATRSNNIPVKTTLGIAGVTIADNADEGGAFWTRPTSKDTIHGPDVVSDRTVWRAFAVDHSGPYRNVSTDCKDRTTDAAAPRDGNPQAILEGGKFGGELSGSFDKQPTKYINTRGACPDFTGRGGGTVKWSFSHERYSTGSGFPQDVTGPLLTLFVTNQVGVDDAHVETTFNTREFGQTSHQSWENLAHPNAAKVKDSLREAEANIRREHRCDRPYPKPPFRLEGWKQQEDRDGEPTNVWTAPDGKNEWALVSCRITATVIPPYDAEGDDPAVWREALESYELSAPLMGARLPPQPQVHSVSPDQGHEDVEVTVVGVGFAERGNTVMFGERGCSVKDVASIEGKGHTRTISVRAPECAGGKGGKNVAGVRVQVFDGRATSSDDVSFTMTK